MINTYFLAPIIGKKYKISGPQNDKSIIRPIIKNQHLYEPHVQRQMYYAVNKGNICIDIGANLGQHTLLLNDLVGKDGLVISIEAGKETYNILQNNIKNNRAKQVKAINTGIWDKLCEMEFSYSEDNIGCCFFDTKGYRKGIIENVRMTTIDHIVNDFSLSRLDFLKIDIEGGEYRALIGGEQSIRKFQPTIIIELNIKTIDRFTEDSVNCVIQKLEELNYQFRVITQNGALEINSLELISLFYDKGHVMLDVICLPKKP